MPARSETAPESELPEWSRQVFTAPPTEDDLLTCSLWDERDKLYGHGYDLVAVASGADPAIPLVASAANARKAKSAGIRLWDARTWTEVQHLLGHQQSVHQLAFAPSSPSLPSGDRLLASVSRDMHVGLWERVGRAAAADEGPTSGPLGSAPVSLGFEYVLASMEKAHTRQVYSLAWTPDGSHLLTGARDKTIRLWKAVPAPANRGTGPSAHAVEPGTEGVVSSHATVQLRLVGTVDTLSGSPSALACAAYRTAAGTTRWVLVAGTDEGRLLTYSADAPRDAAAALEWQRFEGAAVDQGHAAEVTRVVFAPTLAKAAVQGDDAAVAVAAAALGVPKGTVALFASASLDHSLRLWRLSI